MTRENHLKVDRFFWGEEFPDIHSWLDKYYPEFAKTNPYRHWLKRHHMKAIREKYGHSQQFNVAYLHILSDFLNGFEIALVPKNEKELAEKLKKLGMI